MLFGQKQQFAIECIIDPQYHCGVWMNGYISFYLANERWGDIEEMTSLRDVLSLMENFINTEQYRIIPPLFSKTADEILTLIEDAEEVHYPAEYTDETKRIFGEDTPWAPGQLELIPRLDVFSSWSGYLVSDGAEDKILYGHPPEKPMTQLCLKHGIVDAIMKEAHDWLAEQHDRLRAQPINTLS